MRLSRRQFVALTLLGTASEVVLAQPEHKVVRMIVPNAVGSSTDALARSVQPALNDLLKGSVVVDNQPGAGGILGMQALARSKPDGATLSIVSNNVVIFPSVLKSVPFRMPDDFTPIAMLGSTPLVLVVNPNTVSAKNSKEFIELLKSQPEKYTYASGGNGTILHLASAMFLDEVGATALHVPYKGVGPMISDLLGGQVDFATAGLPSLQSHIASGKLRAIGVCTPERVASAPDLPTFVEQGVPNHVVEAWFAALGPAGLSAAEVKRLNGVFVAAFDNPQVKQAMSKQGNTIEVSTPEQATATFKNDLTRYERLVRKTGVQPT